MRPRGSKTREGPTYETDFSSDEKVDTRELTKAPKPSQDPALIQARIDEAVSSRALSKASSKASSKATSKAPVPPSQAVTVDPEEDEVQLVEIKIFLFSFIDKDTKGNMFSEGTMFMCTLGDWPPLKAWKEEEINKAMLYLSTQNKGAKLVSVKAYPSYEGLPRSKERAFDVMDASRWPNVEEQLKLFKSKGRT